MNKNKTISLAILALFAIMFTFSFVSGAVTFVSPTASSVQSQTSTLNVTGVALDNCTFYAYSSSTANSTWSAITAVVKNESGDKVAVASTFNSTGLEDSNDYYFNATCRNSSNDIHVGTVSTVSINNTTPGTPSSLIPSASTIYANGSVYFSATVTDGRTTGCTLNFDGKNPGASSYTMTYSTTSCTHSLTNVPEESYTYYIRASDGTEKADSTYTTFSVDSKTSAGGSAVLISSGQAVSADGAEVTLKTSLFSGDKTQILVALIIIGLLVVLIMRKK